MRRQNIVAMLVLIVAVAGCAATQQQRELQAATAIATANDTAAQALDFGIIKADEGEAIQAITRVATADLKRAIAARRAGIERSDWDAIMDIVFDALNRTAVILAGREK